jgi:hypothetical protein
MSNHRLFFPPYVEEKDSGSIDRSLHMYSLKYTHSRTLYSLIMMNNLPELVAQTESKRRKTQEKD